MMMKWVKDGILGWTIPLMAVASKPTKSRTKSCFLQEPKPVSSLSAGQCSWYPTLDVPFIYLRLCCFFSFKNKINHSVLKDLLDPIKELYEDVRRKALMRLEYEGLHKSEAITMSGARFHNNPAGFAMNRYAYYVCFKCKKVRSSCHSCPCVFSVLYNGCKSSGEHKRFSRIFLLYSGWGNLQKKESISHSLISR